MTTSACAWPRRDRPSRQTRRAPERKTEPGAARSTGSLDQAEELYAEFRVAWKSMPEDPKPIGRLMWHPFSQAQLESACAAALRRWMRNAELYEDVIQEAACLVLQKLERRELTFVDQGLEEWQGWLWTVWFCACRNAWRRSKPLWLRVALLSEHDGQQLVDERLPEWERLDERHDVALAILQLPNRSLAAVVTDWLDGLRACESAIRCGLSESAVSKLRRRVVEILRRRFGV